MDRKKKYWLSRTFFSCLASKIIDVRNQAKMSFFRGLLFRAGFDQTILCYVPSGHFMISYDIQTTEFNCYLSPSHVNKGTRLLSPPDQIEKKNVHLAVSIYFETQPNCQKGDRKYSIWLIFLSVNWFEVFKKVIEKFNFG